MSKYILTPRTIGDLSSFAIQNAGSSIASKLFSNEKIKPISEQTATGIASGTLEIPQPEDRVNDREVQIYDSDTGTFRARRLTEVDVFGAALPEGWVWTGGPVSQYNDQYYLTPVGITGGGLVSANPNLHVVSSRHYAKGDRSIQAINLRQTISGTLGLCASARLPGVYVDLPPGVNLPILGLTPQYVNTCLQGELLSTDGSDCSVNVDEDVDGNNTITSVEITVRMRLEFSGSAAPFYLRILQNSPIHTNLVLQETRPYALNGQMEFNMHIVAEWINVPTPNRVNVFSLVYEHGRGASDVKFIDGCWSVRVLERD